MIMTIIMNDCDCFVVFCAICVVDWILVKRYYDYYTSFMQNKKDTLKPLLLRLLLYIATTSSSLSDIITIVVDLCEWNEMSGLFSRHLK